MITQRLILDGPDRVPTCVGCHGPLIEGVIQHPHDCPELRQGGISGPLPSPAQVCAWLAAHGWAQASASPSGALWQPPGVMPQAVAIPAEDGDAWFLAGALERIATRSGLPLGEVLAGMRATEVGEESDA